MKAVRSVLAVLAVLLAASMAVIPAPGPAIAQQQAISLGGVLHNGTADADFDAAALPVTLSIVEGVTALAPRTTQPRADGLFEFEDVPVLPSVTYFLTAEYQGAVYSVLRQADELTEPIVLNVFEATNDPSVLTFESYSIIVTGADRNERVLEVLERASVWNESDRTLVPDIDAEGPAMLSFLRFALPAGATHLDVRSNLVGGQILEVDRGFALTTPVPPTAAEPHQFEFIYRLRYDGTSIDLGRTLRFGAEALRVVVPEDTGRGYSPRLADLGATPLGDRQLRLLEGTGVEPGEFLELRIEGLPTPTAWSLFTAGAGKWYLAAGIPALLVTGLTIMLTVTVMRRRVSVDLSPTADLAGQRHALLEQAAELELGLASGKLSRRRYDRERDEVKQALMSLDLRSQAISLRGT